MVRAITAKATVQQTRDLALFLDSKGHSPEEALAWLKSKQYTVKNLRFQASQVASFIAGRQSMRAEFSQCKTLKDFKGVLNV